MAYFSDTYMNHRRNQWLRSIVAVEAQLSGLPCIVSDRVDPLVLLSSRSELLSLKSGKEWAHRAFELSRLPSESMSDKMKMFSEAENASKVLELVLE